MNTTESKVAMLQTRLNQPIETVLEKLNYPQSVRDLFRLQETEWKQLYPDEASKLQSHLKSHETRTILDIGKETCLAWVVEDLTALDAKRSGKVVKLNGSDCNRRFTDLSETAAKPDLLVSYDGGKSFRKVEVTASFTDFFAVNGSQSFRFQKLQNLQKSKALLLTLDIFANQSFIVEAADLFSSSATNGKFWKREERINFDHAILRREADCIKVLPIEWRQIPGAFWRV